MVKWHYYELILKDYSIEHLWIMLLHFELNQHYTNLAIAYVCSYSSYYY